MPKPVKGEFNPDIRKAVDELKALRIMIGMSMRELCRRTGFSDSTLRDWELHRVQPSLPNMIEYAKALGYSVAFTIEPLED